MLSNDMELYPPLKIFIADDDADDREFLRFLFEKNDRFEILGCYDSGAAVIEQINKGNVPDMLLIDMYMPKMTGAEVLTQLIEQGHSRKLFVFVISTTVNQSQQEIFSQYPRVKFLAKPTTLEQLNDLPGQLLESLHLANNTKV
ncbi:MAG TPA: response regulator [Haliscomenobacter sp.]|nr:response regulator [Haliscomenobacter sp.]